MDMLVTLSRKRNTIDLVLIDTYSTLNFWYAIAVARLCVGYNVPYIPILHGGNLSSRLKSSFAHLQFLIDHAHVSISPSSFLKEDLSAAGLDNIRVIKNTIPIEDYTFKHRELVKPKLLWVRSFSKIYNPSMAVELLRLLKIDFPDAELCMVGPDKDGTLAEVKKLASGYDLNIRFTGKITKEEWRELSCSYDIFINTTHLDNVPISVLESMALGLPVVSTDVGGIPYMLENGRTGVLVPDNGTEAMNEAVTQLLNDPVKAASISMAARKEAEKYSWNTVMVEWDELLSQIPRQGVKNN